MNFNAMKDRNTLLTLILFVSFCIFVFIITNDNNSNNNIKLSLSIHYNRLRDRIKAPKIFLDKQNAYLVNTSKCQIIRWPIFDDQVLDLYENKSNDRIYCRDSADHKISIERFNFNGIRVINKSDKKVECFWSHVLRSSGTDDKVYYRSSLPLETNETKYFPSNVTLVKTTCFIDDGEKGYEKVIPLIQPLESNGTVNDDKNLPNILFVGLDSISRVNFDRHFVKTSQLLSKHNFYSMYGYNKVADNTFVNLTPLLTGFYLEDIWNETISKNTFLNYFPFIWKEYKEKGFSTLLMEDAPDFATFNYLKIGFSDPPTDYYLRPYSLAIEKEIHSHCYLDKTEIDTYYEYIYDFLKAMNDWKQKYFAFTFMARLTHDDLNNAGLADPLVYNLLNKLFTEELLKNTVLVFFSDHGIRFGKIRETLTGKLEERMPFMHIYVPNEWQTSELAINENRLTTPFDIHATLRHIVSGEPDLGLKYGKSLLEEIPEERSCDSVPILEHWCSCQTSHPVTDLTQVEFISQFIVENVNQLVAKQYGKECVQLVLDKTLSAFEQQLSEKVLNFEQSLNDVIGRKVTFNKNTREDTKHYMVSIRVKPSAALFEATVNVNVKTKKMVLLGEVSRINAYGNQSNCIDNQFVRRYCFCKNFL